MRPGKRLSVGERGQELVEFALVSTLFFMIMLGTIGLGIGIWQYNMLSNLAQEGARWASVRGTSSTLPGSPATQSAVQTFVQGRALGTWGGSLPVTVSPTPVGAPGTTVTVTVTETFSLLPAIVPLPSLAMSARASMIVSR